MKSECEDEVMSEWDDERFKALTFTLYTVDMCAQRSPRVTPQPLTVPPSLRAERSLAGTVYNHLPVLKGLGVNPYSPVCGHRNCVPQSTSSASDNVKHPDGSEYLVDK